MTERPILFSGPMVRAILDGRKTQTRRVAKDRDKPCKYGIAGDRLWVRETWQSAAAMGVCHASDDYFVYRATDPDWETCEGWQWRPSIFMPRKASRITLEITDVRAERLQDITNKDARAEGLARGTVYPRMWFEDLWDSINAKRGFGWDVNPFVWVITFKKVGSNV